MKHLPLILCALLCLAPSKRPVRSPKGAEIFVDPKPKRVLLMPPVPTNGPMRLTTRAMVAPRVITNVTITWTLEPIDAALATVKGAKFSTNSPATNDTHVVTWIEGTTNLRTWYPVTPFMAYAPTNWFTKPMIDHENFRAVWGWRRLTP